MTERKPPGVNFESWVDKQIREASERGELDNLPGAGKPIPDLHKPHDDLWWVRQKMESEGLSAATLLPTPLRLRKEIEQLPDTVRGLPTEQAVRDLVEKLNQQVMEWLRAPSGPQVPVGPASTEDVVRQWRTDRTAVPSEASAATSQDTTDEPEHRTPWWQRLTPGRRAPG